MVARVLGALGMHMRAGRVAGLICAGLITVRRAQAMAAMYAPTDLGEAARKHTLVGRPQALWATVTRRIAP
jgi:hypothetical protein